MKIWDLTLTLSEFLPVWPGDPEPRFEKKMQLEAGDIATVTYMKMGVHTGTHVDAPCHFIKGGEGIEQLALDILVGPALVIELLNITLITREVLEKVALPSGTLRLLIKTNNSKQWKRGVTGFDPSYVAISADGAEYLVEKGIQLIGVDAPSVAPFDAIVATHEILLSSKVIVIESLDLSEIKSGTYTLCCLPLKIVGSDGAPARVILIEGSITSC